MTLKELNASIKNLFVKNNTLTSDYDVSADLSKRIVCVISAKPHGLASTQFPVIFTKISQYIEETSAMGDSAEREASMVIDVYGCVQHGAGLSPDIADDEALQLTQNILTLIRAKNGLSVTGAWSEEAEISMDETEGEEDTFVKINRVSIKLGGLIL